MSLTNRQIQLPDVRVPLYQLGKVSSWEISLEPVPPVIRGYFNGLMQDHDKQTPVLRRYYPNSNKPRVWMSFTPMELESHALHIASAAGNVVVCGLGLGMYIYNILSKPEVRSVTVIEHDADVLRLFKEVSGFETWEGSEKLTILIGDALSPNDVLKEACINADYLYADIWEQLGSETALEDMSRICSLYKPTTAGYWGQELDIFLSLGNLSHPAEALLDREVANTVFSTFADDTGIPIDSEVPNRLGYDNPYGLYVYLSVAQLVLNKREVCGYDY